MRGWLIAALLAAAIAGPASAQQASPPVLVVDRERVLNESRPAAVLRAALRERSTALRAQIEEVSARLETEEAEIAASRASMTSDEFEARVRDFDSRVREERARHRVANEALQAEFAAAQRRLGSALSPILEEVLRERGAALILDARFALAALPEVDVTADVITRFAETEIDFGLTPLTEDAGAQD